jgi:TolA-binding protein
MRAITLAISVTFAWTAAADEAKKTIKGGDIDTSGARKRSKADDLAEEEARRAQEKLEALVPTVVEEDKDVGKTEVKKGPVLEFDKFRRAVEMKVKGKREQLIDQLDEILDTVQDDDPERPALLFQKAELLLEDSQFFFLEGMGLDDKIAAALDSGDDEKVIQYQDNKQQYLDDSRDRVRDAVLIYQEIEEEYPDFERMPDVLYALGRAFWDVNSYKKALSSFKKLIKNHPKSKFVPDAYLTFGEYYFQYADENDRDLNRALASYQKAAEDQDTEIFAYAVYKQGWCYYNLLRYDKAAERFKEVVLYSQINEDILGKKRKASLAKEARRDFVLAYAQYGKARQAPGEFKQISEGDEYKKMIGRLGDIYYNDGKDRDAIIIYQMLMKMNPDSSKNPLYQGKIVKLASRIGVHRQVVGQARRLVEEFKKVRNRVQKLPEGDPKREAMAADLRAAEEVSDNTLRYLATTWHNDARRLRNDELFQYAYELYGDYLELFPDKKESYSIRFFYAQLLYRLEKFQQSGEQYIRVYQQNPKGKLAADSAESALFAYDEVIKDYNRTNKRKPSVGNKQMPIPDVKKKYIAASKLYSENYPKGKYVTEAKYKIARTMYDYNYFDDSTPRFMELVDKSPKHARAIQAANLVLDTFEILQDYQKMNDVARRLWKNKRLRSNPDWGEFEDLLATVLEESSFKLITGFEKERKWVEAAGKYLAFVKEFPKSKLADKSLANGAAMFTRAGQLERAIKVRKQLCKQFPKSPLVPDQMFNVASGYEQVVAYRDAADWLERFVEANPKDPRAKDALFNASIYRQGVGQTKKAIEDREKYMKKYAKTKDAADIALSIPVAWEQAGKKKKAMESYLEYAKNWQRKDPKKALNAQYKAVRMLQSMGKRYKREAEKQIGVLEFRARKVKPNDEVADPFAFLAFRRAEKKMEAFRKQTIARPDNPKKFQKSLKEKSKGKDTVYNAYTNVVKFKSPEWAVAALYQIGLANGYLVKALRGVPAPKVFNEEQKMLFKDQLNQQTFPLEEQAAQSMVLCLDKSAELGVFNEWTRRCLSFLEENRTDEFPKATLEEAPKLAVEKKKTQQGTGFVLQLPKEGETLTAAKGTEPPPPPAGKKISMRGKVNKEEKPEGEGGDDWSFDEVN